MIYFSAIPFWQQWGVAYTVWPWPGHPVWSLIFTVLCLLTIKPYSIFCKIFVYWDKSPTRWLRSICHTFLVFTPRNKQVCFVRRITASWKPISFIPKRKPIRTVENLLVQSDVVEQIQYIDLLFSSNLISTTSCCESHRLRKYL